MRSNIGGERRRVFAMQVLSATAGLSRGQARAAENQSSRRRPVKTTQQRVETAGDMHAITDESLDIVHRKCRPLLRSLVVEDGQRHFCRHFSRLCLTMLLCANHEASAIARTLWKDCPDRSTTRQHATCSSSGYRTSTEPTFLLLLCLWVCTCSSAFETVARIRSHLGSKGDISSLCPAWHQGRESYLCFIHLHLLFLPLPRFANHYAPKSISRNGLFCIRHGETLDTISPRGSLES